MHYGDLDGLTTQETPSAQVRGEILPPPLDPSPPHDTIPCPPPECDPELTDVIDGMLQDLSRSCKIPGGD